MPATSSAIASRIALAPMSRTANNLAALGWGSVVETFLASFVSEGAVLSGAVMPGMIPKPRIDPSAL